ncbi:MAG: hypothetical protein A3E36_03880 [Candidatus Andersenbacteria bacterium RIFCSPHIGHO2_12_FULL_45_11b]|uniref:Uncharacterized protein n=1 Tax=Candidatus Andersenbacteria bacterium RIFCSPHIGHO2_12_FULL_45_11b TaxID=1797282 RepID=A0A1G1XBM8_9BACT|nr:MAG: hypothetical protein A3E36_03880 [Candidatus Andersenbacteria bacterium RIFCSPHIGHO2_12_FULL_45_11b]
MVLNEKMAFEVWSGFIVLVVLIGSVAGATLLLSNSSTSNQVKTQINKNSPTPVPFASDSDIQGAASSITGAILGGKSNP